jgi:protein gp37
MSKTTKIEWCDHTLNPVKGLCPMACPYCYARRMYKRFKWDESIRFELDVYDTKELQGEDGDKYFIGSTMELFGDWIKEDWVELTIDYTQNYPKRTFIFLTKQPQNIKRYSPFPDNCWVGVSTTGNDCRSGLEDIMSSFEARVKFVSIEPLLDYTPMDFRWVDWVIVGQQTPIRKATVPHLGWIYDIAMDTKKVGVPLFLKENLRPLLFPEEKEIAKLWGDKHMKCSMRQEFPIGG